MNDVGLLLTTAEIAVAFAGFAGLISVIGRGSASDPRRAVVLLRYAIEVALFVVAFSLIPLLPLSYGLAAEASWRLSSLLFIVGSQLGMVVMTRRYLRAELPIAARDTVISGALSIGSDLLLLVNTLGFFGSAAFPVYLTGLFANLGLAGFFFLLVVGSVLPSTGDRES